jgi:hypothetical protein
MMTVIMSTLFNMSGYTKLFSSIIDSTIWRESKETKIVWITMLAKADAKGVVEASLPGLADAARVTLEECIKALKVLSSSDEYSRTKTNEGRRIQEVEGGWLILNHDYYRNKLNKEHRKEYQRIWQKNSRGKKKGTNKRAEFQAGERAYEGSIKNGASEVEAMARAEAVHPLPKSYEDDPDLDF